MNFSLKRVTYYFSEDVSFYYIIFISSKLTGAINFVEMFGFVEFFFYHKFALHNKDCMLLITTITESSLLLLISYSGTYYLVFNVVMF